MKPFWLVGDAPGAPGVFHSPAKGRNVF
jgi:hypothetical protein